MTKPRKNIHDWRLRGYFLLAFLEGVVTVLTLTRQPSEKSQAVFLGLSFQRLLFVFGAVILSLVFLFFFVRSLKENTFEAQVMAWLRRKAAVLPLSAFFAGIFFSVACLVPEYRFADWGGYVERLRPLILWAALLAGQTFLLLAWGRKTASLAEPKGGKEILAFFLLFLSVWGFIAWTGLGIRPDDRYWNEAGVPLLNEQILYSLILSFLLWHFLLKKALNSSVTFFRQKGDALVFVLLWAVTAFFWVKEPLPRNFFAPGPYPPNYELAPFADTAVFDLGGQFALLGQGLFNGHFYARALLSGFLAILHFLVGQNYEKVVAVQTILFAVLVPILYLIGKELHSRLAGFLSAFFIFFKGINAIASSTWILSSHPKYLLTEFPTAIFLALFTLWMIRWTKEKQQVRFLVLGGGALGLGIMLRTNILFFLPLAIGVVFFYSRRNWRKLLQAALVFLLAFFITISPWMWRSWKVADRPFFFLDIISEVIRTRYSVEVELPNSHPADEILATGYPKRARVDAKKQDDVVADGGAEFSAWQFIPNHFFHNITASVLILPTSFSFHDLRHTIYEVSPYWSKKGAWTGALSAWEKLGMLRNIFFLAIGVGSMWKKWRMAGLLPLLVFLTYHLSNAAARTSGGRYLVPVDWVVLLYYALGILTLLSWVGGYLGFRLGHQENEESFSVAVKPSLQKTFSAILPFFFLVASITLLDQSLPPYYADWTQEEIQAEVYRSAGISEDELTRFLENPDARLLLGRSLYPRFYGIGEGEHSVGKDAYAAKEFPRLSFTLIGKFGQVGVILPLDESPRYYPNGADVIMLGCRHSDTGVLYPYTDALAVIVLDGAERTLYTREPSHPLECPLPEPVCDENHICE